MNFIDLTINNGECTIDTLKIDNLPKDMSKGTLGVRAEDFEVATEGLKTKAPMA